MLNPSSLLSRLILHLCLLHLSSRETAAPDDFVMMLQMKSQHGHDENV